MNKAFLFDMDGVLVASEGKWRPHDDAILRKFFDEKTRKQIGDTTGLGVRGIYQKACEAGSNIEFSELAKAYDNAALEVYRTAPIIEAGPLVEKLRALDFKLGLVTSSPQRWIDQVVSRLSWHRLDVIVSIGDRSDLKPKPSPDGFIDALRSLNADPKQSIVLEDSNYGIAAGKAAKCYTIGFRGNPLPDYVQTGADIYADTMDDVIEIVENRLKQGPRQV